MQYTQIEHICCGIWKLSKIKQDYPRFIMNMEGWILGAAYSDHTKK